MATILVECPCCRTQLEVEKDSGKVVQKWERQQGSGDKMKDALERMKAEKEKRANFFQNAQKDAEKRKKEADEKFEKEKDRIQREGDVSRPPNPFDLD